MCCPDLSRCRCRAVVVHVACSPATASAIRQDHDSIYDRDIRKISPSWGRGMMAYSIDRVGETRWNRSS